MGSVDLVEFSAVDGRLLHSLTRGRPRDLGCSPRSLSRAGDEHLAAELGSDLDQGVGDDGAPGTENMLLVTDVGGLKPPTSDDEVVSVLTELILGRGGVSTKVEDGEDVEGDEEKK